MKSKITIMGHPVHPMLIPFPVASYVATLLCFIAYQSTENAFWFHAGYVANIAGIVTALLAAVVGFTDWIAAIPRHHPARRTGRIHMVLNVTALVFFVLNAWLQSGQWGAVAPVARGAVILPLIGVLLTMVAGFFGWKMVQDHHVGVRLTAEQERIDTMAQPPVEEHRRRAV